MAGALQEHHEKRPKMIIACLIRIPPYISTLSRLIIIQCHSAKRSRAVAQNGRARNSRYAFLYPAPRSLREGRRHELADIRKGDDQTKQREGDLPQ